MPRLENVTVACPIVYGSIAFFLGKKADEFATHRWTLFVRGPQDEDLSTFVEKISFTLHPSFPDPIREITSPPFEVTETGWGEFEIVIRIYFKDPEEEPIDVFHLLKLYPPAQAQNLSVKKPVVSEIYDEIVFTSPNDEFHKMLLKYGDAPLDPSIRKPTAFPEYYTNFDDSLDVETLLAIQAHLTKEVNDTRQRLINSETEIVEMVIQKQKEASNPPTNNNANNANNANNTTTSTNNNSNNNTTTTSNQPNATTVSSVNPPPN